MNEKIPESKQEWCVTTAKRAFVNARAERLDAEIISEIQPTSEGARTLAEKLWLYSLDSVQAFVTIIPDPENHPSAIDEIAKSIEAYSASLRSQLAAAEKERDEARSLIPHPGDGSCDHCGKIPAIDIPTRLCDECSDGVKRLMEAMELDNKERVQVRESRHD